MDQATASATMDSRKPAVRSLQLGSKAPNSSDANREVCKRSYGGARRQRDLERDGLVGGGCGGARGKAYGGPGKVASGRSSNKVNRSKEKEGKQVRNHGLGSLDHYDDEYYDSSERLRHPPQHLGGDPRPYRNSAYYGGYGDRRGDGSKKLKQRCSSSVLYKTHTNERSFQARCQFLVNYKKEAEAVANASMPVGFSLSAAAAHPSSSATDPADSACPAAGGPGNRQEGWMETVEAALNDPDSLVSWGSVEEVLLHTTEPFNCPVCLYPPVAPQVTRCGHIYCYPCILHYLALSDKKWRGCPICNLLVVREDLKSVVFEVHPDYRVGSSIQMHLMSRHRDSPVAVPVLGERKAPGAKHACCRTMRASAQKVLAIIERERTALEVQMVIEGSEPEACFIEEALTLLQERQQNLPDFGPEITDRLTDLTLCDYPTAELRPSEQEQQLASKTKQANANVFVEKGPKLGSSQRVNLPGESVSKHVQADLLNVGASQQSALESQGLCEGRVRNSSGSGNSGSDVSVPVSSHVSSLPVSSSHELLGLRASPNDDSDDSSSISSSVSNELIFSDITVDVVSPETGSASESSSGLSPIEISLPNFEGAAPTPTLDDSDVAGASAPSECLQFDLEDKMGGKVVATTVRKKKQQQKAPKSMHYFYQANDGSHVYLQPLNFAMLAREFGGAANCPTTISANIVEMEYGTMTDRAQTQGNRRFLCHLPLCCCYELVELDLRTLVSARTLGSFKSSLDWREHARAQRAKKEQLIELRNREKEEKEYSGRLFQYVKSAFTGPPSRQSDVVVAAAAGAAEFNEENYPAMGSTSGGRPHRHSMSSDGQSSPSLATSPPLSSAFAGRHHGRRKQQQQQISFAKVLTTQTSSRCVQPRPAGGDATPPASASTASVWGRPARPGDQSSSSGAASRSAADADDEDDESRFSAPDFKRAYAMSLDVMLANALNASPAPGAGGKKNKKGKKMKPVVVLSSGGGF